MALAVAKFRTAIERVFNDFLMFTQLYKLSGGNPVDGLPPAPSLPNRFEIPDFSNKLDHLRRVLAQTNL